MPNHVKAILSLLVAAVAAGMFWYQDDIGMTGNAWVAAGLAAFMIAAVWLFPEAKGRKQKGEDWRR
jgi:hypothetical protein